jgi:small subunit ribosomal protein S8
MVSDPIADMLAQIKNASLAGRSTVALPHSKLKEKVAAILVKEGYVKSLETTGEIPKRMLVLTLKYQNKRSVITDVKRKSKPGLRRYIPKTAIPTVLGGVGIAIISTSSGIMTGQEAKKQGNGGELICEIW